MSRELLLACLLFTLLLPPAAEAQLFPPLTNLIEPAPVSSRILNAVDLVVEADTYKPAFYRGRAEPTVGNTVRLVAVPLGEASENFSYQWRVNGQALSSAGPVAVFSDLFNNELRVSVAVVDAGGVLFGTADEIVRLSRPEVVFYEANVLRGHGSKAIGNTHTLIGDEGVVRAEPYFVGLQANPSSYRTTWRVNNAIVSSGGDWRELLLKRPDSPQSNYRIEFSAVNSANLAESVYGKFNLNFGL